VGQGKGFYLPACHKPTVVGNKAGIPRIAIGYERQKKEEGEV
jgi:hypothetical protein